MLNKTIKKEKRRSRETWVGYYPRLTSSKVEKVEKRLRVEKSKKDWFRDEE